MPELPEVETVRRDIREVLVGESVSQCSVSGLRTVRRTSAREVEDQTTGWEISEVGRHGKYLMLHGTGRSDVWFVHLRMSGRFEWVAPGHHEQLAPHTHIRWTLRSGAELRFVDPRTFGEVFVVEPALVLGRLGPDPITSRWAPTKVADQLVRSGRAVADVLVDQRVVAGVGNIYCSEITHRAGVDPLRKASSLDAEAAGRIARAIPAVLREAVKYRGTTLADLQYRGLDGSLGGYQHRLRAYGRSGQPCARCGGVIERVRHGGRSIYRCASCQD